MKPKGFFHSNTYLYLSASHYLLPLVVVVEVKSPNTLRDNLLSPCIRLREGLSKSAWLPPLRGVMKLE